MSIVQDIITTYRKPQQVFAGLLDGEVSESRTLAILMGGCVGTFVSSWPALARQAHLEAKDVTDLMGGALLAWVFIMPLVFYVLAMMLWGIQRVLMGRARMDQVRIVLFWSFFCIPPIYVPARIGAWVHRGRWGTKYRGLYLVCDHCVVCDIRL